MIDKVKIQRAIDIFTLNPPWQTYYSNAPSYVIRRHIELQFAVSMFCIILRSNEMDEIAREMHRLEGLYALEEWKYEFAWSGHNPHRTVCEKKIIEYMPDLPPLEYEGIYTSPRNKINPGTLKGYLFSIGMTNSSGKDRNHTDKTYQQLLSSVKKTLKNKNMYYTVYGDNMLEAFITKDIKEAYGYSSQYIQYSIYDLDRDIVLLNPTYYGISNPIRPFIHTDDEEEGQNNDNQ